MSASVQVKAKLQEAQKITCLWCGLLSKKGTGRAKDGSPCTHCGGLGEIYYYPRASSFMLVEPEE